MILHSKTLLFLSMVLLIGTLFGAIGTNAFADDRFQSAADNQFRSVASDPFRNIGEIDDDIFADSHTVE